MKTFSLRGGLASKAKTFGVLAAVTLLLAGVACFGTTNQAYAQDYTLNYTYANGAWGTPNEDKIPTTLGADDSVTIVFAWDLNSKPSNLIRIYVNDTKDVDAQYIPQPGATVMTSLCSSDKQSDSLTKTIELGHDSKFDIHNCIDYAGNPCIVVSYNSHAHQWNYEVRSGCLWGWCSNSTGSASCEHFGEDNAITMMMTDDYKNPFGSAVLEEWINAGLEEPTVKYYLEDGSVTTPENSGADAEGGVPTKSGKYTVCASVQNDQVALSKSFEIAGSTGDDGDQSGDTAKDDQAKANNTKGTIAQTGDSAAPFAAVAAVCMVAAVAGLAVAKRKLQ